MVRATQASVLKVNILQVWGQVTPALPWAWCPQLSRDLYIFIARQVWVASSEELDKSTLWTANHQAGARVEAHGPHPQSSS